MSRDKILHLLVGFIIVLVTVPFVGVYWALALCITFGAAKEYLYDIKFPKKHKIEVADVVYTVVGGLMGVGVFYLL